MSLTISAARSAAMASAGTTNNPILAYDTILTAGTTALDAGTADVDLPVANAFSGTTFDYASITPASGAVEISKNYASNRLATFAGIVGHNLGTIGGSVAFESSSDGGFSWDDCGCGTISPTDDKPIGMYFNQLAKVDYRFNFTGLSTNVLRVAVLWAGRVITVPIRAYQGVAPILAPNNVSLQSSVSVGGNLLGSSVVSRGSSFGLNFDNVDETFVRGDLAEMIPVFNEGNPIWIAWRPTKYAEDLHYCWRDGDVIQPTNAGPRDLMSFSLNVRVFEG